MKVLSIIGVVFFSLMFLIAIVDSVNFEEPLEELELLDSLGKVFDDGDTTDDGDMTIKDFTDSIWGLIGQNFITSIFGIALSITGIVASDKARE